MVLFKLHAGEFESRNSVKKIINSLIVLSIDSLVQHFLIWGKFPRFRG